RRCISWRQFILALGLHTSEEMELLGFARLAEHFGLLTKEGLQRLTIIAPTLQPDAAAGAPRAAKGAPIVDEGDQAVPEPMCKSQTGQIFAAC
ncbi:hypothetical protein Tco_1462283, partial [Tanacetum coccineum]